MDDVKNDEVDGETQIPAESSGSLGFKLSLMAQGSDSNSPLESDKTAESKLSEDGITQSKPIADPTEGSTEGSCDKTNTSAKVGSCNTSTLPPSDTSNEPRPKPTIEDNIQNDGEESDEGNQDLVIDFDDTVSHENHSDTNSKESDNSAMICEKPLSNNSSDKPQSDDVEESAGHIKPINATASHDLQTEKNESSDLENKDSSSEKVNDDNVNYFEKLECRLKEFEKTLESSREKAQNKDCENKLCDTNKDKKDLDAELENTEMENILKEFQQSPAEDIKGNSKDVDSTFQLRKENTESKACENFEKTSVHELEKTSDLESEKTRDPESEKSSIHESEKTSIHESEKTSDPESEKTSDPESEKSSIHESEKTSIHESEKTSVHESEKTSDPESEKSSIHESEKTSVHESEKPSLQESEKTIVHENNSSDNVVVDSEDLQSCDKTDGISQEKGSEKHETNHDSEQPDNQSTLKRTVKKSAEKPPSSENPSEAWSKIGMKRCPHCSFTTDQESMLESHTVLCNKRFMKRGDISLKYKANRYGCESCLFTTKLRRNFEEHIAFHLLAQPYICLTCVLTFDSKVAIEKHVKQQHTSGQVKCGLRGSKKVNHILDTLHATGTFNFTGRVLDKKVWMASSDMKQKEKTSTNATVVSTEQSVFASQSEKLLLSSNTLVTTSTPVITIARPELSTPSVNISAGTVITQMNVSATQPVMPRSGNNFLTGQSMSTTGPSTSILTGQPVATAGHSNNILTGQPVATASHSNSILTGQSMATTGHSNNILTGQSVATTGHSNNMATTQHVVLPTVSQNVSTGQTFGVAPVNNNVQIGQSLGTRPLVAVSSGPILRPNVPSVPTLFTGNPQNSSHVILNQVSGQAAFNSQCMNTIIQNTNTIARAGLENSCIPTGKQGVPVLLFPVTLNSTNTSSQLPLNIPHFSQSSSNMVSVLQQPVSKPSMVTAPSQQKNVVVLNQPVIPPTRIMIVNNSATGTNLTNNDSRQDLNNRPQVSLLNKPLQRNVFTSSCQPTTRATITGSPNLSVAKPNVTVYNNSSVSESSRLFTGTTSSYQSTTSTNTKVVMVGPSTESPSSGQITATASPKKCPVVSTVQATPIIFSKKCQHKPSNTVVSVSSVTNDDQISSGNDTSKEETSKLFFRKAAEHYTCDYCNYVSRSENIFRMHIWKHFHVQHNICKICKKNALEGNLQDCLLVEKVMNGLLLFSSSEAVKTPAEEDIIILASDDEDEEDKASKVDGSQTHIVIKDGNITSVETSPLKKTSPQGAGLKDGKETETYHNASESEENEDSGMQLKITSTYSLSTESPVKSPAKSNENLTKSPEKSELSGISRKLDYSPSKSSGNPDSNATAGENCDTGLDKATVQRDESDHTNTSRSPIRKDSGNIFDKLRGSIDLVIQKEYENGKNSESSRKDNDESNKDAQSKESCNTDKSSDPTPLQEPIPSSEGTVERRTPTPAMETTSSKDTSGMGSFYVCGFTDCGFRCMGSGEFRDHLSTSHGDAEEFSCAHCGHKSYTDECHFRHMIGHSKFSSFVLYSCGFPGCLYGTNVKDMFLDHWQKFHPNAKSFKCISCREVFLAVEELVLHLQSNILKFVQCPHCTVKDRNRRVILSHIAEMHPGKPRQITVTSQLVCQEREINAYVVPNVAYLPQPLQPTVKIENDAEISTAVCEEDDNSENYSPEPKEQSKEAYIDTGVEKRHIKGQSAEHHMREVERVLSLDKHRIRLQNSVVLRCPHCTYLASGKGLLKKHMLCHRRGPQRDRPFACPYCPSSMDKLSKLSVHLNLHEGSHKVKVYFCGFCSLKTNIRERMLTHGIKVHKKDFTLFTDVTTKVIRINVRAFFCDECECGFRDKTAYDHHLWTHSDEAKSNPAAPPERPHMNSMSAAKGPQPLPRSLEFMNKAAPNITHPSGSSASQDYSESPILDEMKRFRCKECGKCMSRLPVLKQHMLCHILDQDLELIVFKCSYCAFTSTSKLLVSQHSQEKHPDKLVRVKRRIDVISAADSAHYYNQPIIPNQSSGTDLSIDSFHCDLCSYSCSNAAVLHRHKTAEHPESLSHENYGASRKKFIIPYGNVYKNPVFCSECPYSAKTRLDLLRHIKIHPHLLPETEFSPPKEKPKQLLKVAIGKRRPHQLDFYEKSSPSPEKIANMSSPDQEDKKPVLLENGAVEGYTPKPPTVMQSSLYFLGGDLLHLKLRPCFTQLENGVEHMCLLCEETFAGKYLLHKHILQHMEVYFYKCAYCEHGTLESPAMMVHIQKVHHKPIQHSKIEVTDLESKINKFIHNIKEREYSGNVQMDYDDDNSQDTLPQDDDNDTETSFPRSNSSSPVSTVRSPTESFQHSFTLPKLTSPKRSKALIPVKPVSTADIHPSIKKMGDIFKCKICGYTTTARTTIVQHLTIHSGFKRFGCPFCQYRSHWRHDTIKHIRVHHPDKQGEPTKDDPPNTLDSPSPPMPKLSPQIPVKPKMSPALGPNEAGGGSKENESQYTGGFRYVYKCLLCDAKFRSKWKIFRHFSTSCSQPMLGCSKCKFKDQEPSVVKTHIVEKHANANEEARIISLTRDSKMRKYSIPLINTKSQDRIKIEPTNVTAKEINTKSRLLASSWNLSTLVKRIGNHFKCKECGFTGGNRATVVRHAKRHKIGQIYKCSYCDYKSNLQCNVKRHMQSLHPEEPNVVTHLSSKGEPNFINNLDDDAEVTPRGSKPMTTTDSQDVNSTFKQANESRNYWKCLECGYKANCLGSVYRHFKKAGCLKTMYGCSACKFKSFDRAEVQRHVEKENPSKSAELLVCPSSAKIKKIHNPVKQTKTMKYMKSAEKDKEKDGTNLKDIFCPVCHLKASNENVFQTHLETEHSGQVMMCSYCCCFRTRDVIELQKHTDSSHEGNSIKFQLRSSVDKHKPGNLQCPKCDYAGRRADLKNHLYCHIDYKPFCCPYCQYRCRKSTVITSSHIPRFHPGEPLRVLRKTSIAKEKEVDALLASVSACELPSSSSSEVEPKTVVEEQPKEQNPIISSKVERLGLSNIDGLVPSKLYKTVINSKSRKEAFHCLKCRFTTAIKSTMVSHTYNHMPFIFRCPYCEYQTYPRSMVTKHIKARHPAKKVYVIDERSKNREFLELAAAAGFSDSSPEKSEPPKKKRKVLGMDSDIFSDEASSDEEEPKHKVPKRMDNGRILYCCHLCPFSNESCYHYRQHLATHGGFRWQVPGTELETRLKCGYCSYLALDDHEFTRHMEVHLTSRPFNCPYCDFSQYTQCKVKYHITTCHPDKEVVVRGSSAGTSHSNLSSVMLVQMDPKVRLVDILSVGPEECERILTEANVSVVDFDCLNDDRFTALANTLGISMSEGMSDDALDFVDDHAIKKELLDDSSIKTDVDESSPMMLKTEGGADVVKNIEEEDTMDVSDLSKIEFMVKDEVGADSDEEHVVDSSEKVDSAMEVDNTSPEDTAKSQCQELDDVMDEVMEEINKQPELSSADTETKTDVSRQESSTSIVTNAPSEDCESSVEGQQFITVDTWSPNQDS